MLKAIEKNVQTIITGVDISAFDDKFLENVKIIKVIKTGKLKMNEEQKIVQDMQAVVKQMLDDDVEENLIF